MGTIFTSSLIAEANLAQCGKNTRQGISHRENLAVSFRAIYCAMNIARTKQ